MPRWHDDYLVWIKELETVKLAKELQSSKA